MCLPSNGSDIGAVDAVGWARPNKPTSVGRLNAGREDFVDGKGPEDGQTRKAPLAAPPAAGTRTTFPWPWGLVAIGVMALAWVGIYLLWSGIVFVLGL